MSCFHHKDPFELNRNVSGGFGESGFKRLMYYCKKAEEIVDDLTHKREAEEENLAGVLRLFEIPAPPTPRDVKRRGAYRPNLNVPNLNVHVPFKQNMSTVISLFAEEFLDESVSEDLETSTWVELRSTKIFLQTTTNLTTL